jgi:hypothetical protein
MANPLKSIESWASQSADRASLLLWLTVILLVALVIGSLSFSGSGWRPDRQT